MCVFQFLVIAIFYIENNLQGSFSTALMVAKTHGAISLLIEMFTFSFQAILLALLIVIFVKYIAPSISMFVGSLLITTFYHLFFSPMVFFEHISIFLLIPLLHKQNEHYPSYLFYALYYLVTLAIFSSFRICYLFYGYNTFREILLSCPLFMMILLARRTVYPKTTTLLLLFPCILLPLSLLLHQTPPVTNSFLYLIFSINLSIFSLLHYKSQGSKILTLCLLILSFPFIHSNLVSTTLFCILCLALSLQERKGPRAFSAVKVSEEVNPFFPSLKFYNEVLGYSSPTFSTNYIHRK